MRVLWLCNIMLPVIAEQLGIEGSNKEGWLSGLAELMLGGQGENGITLTVAFPAPAGLLEEGKDILERTLLIKGTELTYYGFRENTVSPHIYEERLEILMKEILGKAGPDVVHCFGTEFPHTLAMCRAFSDKKRLLITIQGICHEIGEIYEADLPGKVAHRATLRDILKRDSLMQQKEKFYLRGKNESEALRLAENIGGRTEWDRVYVKRKHPGVRYFEMRETLRSDFYEGIWSREKCEEHSIFLSQGDYPIKGLHYMLLALPDILREIPDAHVYVAGNSITAHRSLKEKLKLSSYGKYLLQLMKQYGLENKVTFLGRLDSAAMKERYLKSHLFVCPSAIENSPNSLGEAMLLGMPCVTADVGGIPSIFTAGEDGIVYEGCRSKEQYGDGVEFKDQSAGVRKDAGEQGELERISRELGAAVLEMWRDEDKLKVYCQNARAHALRNHDRQENYRTTIEVYNAIAQNGGADERN